MPTLLLADRDPVPALDRGLAYGDGLFETLRVVGRRVVLRTLHLERMVSDAGRLGIPVAFEDLEHALTESVRHFAQDRGQGDWILKLILTRGTGGRGYRPPMSPAPHIIASASAMPPEPDQAGVAVDLATVPLVVNPRLAGIKSLNRLEQVMASREFNGEQWELIMSGLNGDLLEGTRTNLIARVGDDWITPPVEAIAVAGVMRQFVISRLKANDCFVTERPLPSTIADQADLRGLWLLNSVFGAVPVRTLAGVHLPVDDTLATICNPFETLE